MLPLPNVTPWGVRSFEKYSSSTTLHTTVQDISSADVLPCHDRYPLLWPFIIRGPAYTFETWRFRRKRFWLPVERDPIRACDTLERSKIRKIFLVNLTAPHGTGYFFHRRLATCDEVVRKVQNFLSVRVAFHYSGSCLKCSKRVSLEENDFGFPFDVIP
ncbi:hypothetical protein CDAR_426591 [Caerostris darwini]|uniref:Uncharacterized protein n=1 Tax=Caerostris darwini TaxID=1538125 RepID=A0AAV4N717_9ARAC|nr:hypothetical protein CDAR_426591 [Caerostris darwini]